MTPERDPDAPTEPAPAAPTGARFTDYQRARAADYKAIAARMTEDERAQATTFDQPGPAADGDPARTWDTPGGPMLQPPDCPSLRDRLADALAGVDPVIRDVLTRQGRRVSDRLADEATRRRDQVASSIAMSEHVKATYPDRHNQPSHAELERRRSTFGGVVDERILAIRADPDRGQRAARSRRRRRGAA